MVDIIVKCRMCRGVLVTHPKTPIITVHDTQIQPENIFRTKVEDDCYDISDFYFQDLNLPNWMTSKLDEGEWLRGKLNCPSCAARVGSFNFVSQRKCPCGDHVVPPIHIVRNKVDVCKG